MSNSMEDGLDKEGLEVLAELEKEGHTIAGREDNQADKGAEKSDDKSDKQEDSQKDDSQKQQNQDLQKDQNQDSQKANTDDGKKNQQQTDDQDKKIERKTQFVPLPKYLDTEKQLKDALAKIEEISKGAKPNEQTINQAQDAVKILVDKIGYEEEEAGKLVEVLKTLIPGQTLTAEQQKALADVQGLQKQLEEQTEKLKDEREEIAFEKKFSDQILKDFPHLATHKEAIKQMAYSDEYAKVPIRSVALAFMDAEGIDPKTTDTINGDKPGGGNTRQADTIDFNNLTEDQFSKLTPEQQDQFFAYQDNKERSARGALKPLK